MQFSERWLRTFVDPALATSELAHLLTMSGLEVESCEPVAAGIQGVVVGRILSVEKHPNADRLAVCRVDAGDTEPLTIVCGAPNAAAGMNVPCAKVGAKLPGIDIKPVTMRGVESRGMLCSARELGLSNDHAGLLPLAADSVPGTDIKAALGLDDNVFLLKLTPNRADCLSLLGVAREVAALSGAPLEPVPVPPIAPAFDVRFPVKISASRACGRFAGRVLRNVKAGAATPDWMKQRLERCGVRSISALVDVTNYVMLELGQPLHVYDLGKLRGGIDVRFGRKGERVKLLNEQTVEVDESVLCIADESGPIGLAGIMGGESTKAESSTREVFLEAAFFDPAAIAGRARRFNFTSDASHRFERGVDFEGNVRGLERATQLMLEICGGEAGPVIETLGELPKRPPVRMRERRAQRVIGVKVPPAEMAGIFTRLGMECRSETASDGPVFTVTPPSFRFDIEIEEDLIEEVARVYGFDRIPVRPPLAPAVMRSRPETRRSMHDLRDLVAGCDYHEVVNFSFVDADWEQDFAARSNPIRLQNPIAAQLSVMRSTLLGGLVANTRYNVNRKIDRVRVFEIGRVYLPEPSTPETPLEIAGFRQPWRIAGLACGAAVEAQWGAESRTVDFFDVKGDLENLLGGRHWTAESATHPALHPGRSARLLIQGQPIGWLGELHPQWQQKYELPTAAVVFELDVAALLEQSLPRYGEVSRFPPIVRDLAIVVAEAVPVQHLMDALDRVRPGFVQELRVFDVYRGKGIAVGEKSLAFRVVMQDTARTLTDDDADAAMARLTQALVSNFGVRVRS